VAVGVGALSAVAALAVMLLRVRRH
jgi:hypothetical protein